MALNIQSHTHTHPFGLLSLECMNGIGQKTSARCLLFRILIQTIHTCTLIKSHFQNGWFSLKILVLSHIFPSDPRWKDMPQWWVVPGKSSRHYR